MSELKKLLCSSSDASLDASMFPLIQKWDEPDPTSLQILEVLDHCIYGSLASGFIVSFLQALYEVELKQENKTHEQNEPLAHWRKRE